MVVTVVVILLYFLKLMTKLQALSNPFGNPYLDFSITVDSFTYGRQSKIDIILYIRAENYSISFYCRLEPFPPE